MRALEDIFRTPVRMMAGVKCIEAEDEIPFLPGQFTPGKACADYAGMKQPVEEFTVESSTGKPRSRTRKDIVEDGLGIHRGGLPEIMLLALAMMM